MISVGQIQETINLYEKHGWTLRRVLLSPLAMKTLGATALVFGETPAMPSEIDAAWFSRASREKGETWELRRLSGSPFALVEIFDHEDDESVRDEVRHELEQQMIQSVK